MISTIFKSSYVQEKGYVKYLYTDSGIIVWETIESKLQ